MRRDPAHIFFFARWTPFFADATEPRWLRNSLARTRKGKDSLDWFFVAFNKLGLYEYCLKSTPRFITFVMVGAVVGSGFINYWADCYWLSHNKGRVWQDCPYTYPEIED
eukprot:Platyproteum_vivax@DN5361_c0_g1_i1.p1